MKFLSKISLVLVVAVLISCNPEDREHFLIDDPTTGGTVLAYVPPARSFLDFTDLSNAAYEMQLHANDFEGGTLVGSYDIYTTYTDFSTDSTYAEGLYTTVTTFPSDVIITADDFANFFNLPGGLNDLDGGDTFNFRMVVTMKDGTVFDTNNTSDGLKTNRATLQLSTFVGCPTEISAGTYTGTSNGCSNDPFGSTTIAATKDVEVTQLGVVTWNITDITNGYYGLFGFPTEQPVQLLDVCNVINPGGNDGANFGLTTNGTHDPATNTLDLQWNDAANANITCENTYVLN